jgi:calcineurin-like phosphoesterase family protein
MVWVTADYHIEHKNILEYCKRPFKTLTEQLDCIVNNHNAVVGKHDLVYFLGDYSFHGNPDFYQHLFNGRFIYVKGNHDTHTFFKGQPDGIILRKFSKNIHLVHDPAHSQDQLWDITLCGHVHEKWRMKQELSHVYVNVGVDVWGFKPINLNWLIEQIVRGEPF